MPIRYRFELSDAIVQHLQWRKQSPSKRGNFRAQERNLGVFSLVLKAYIPRCQDGTTVSLFSWLASCLLLNYWSLLCYLMQILKRWYTNLLTGIYRLLVTSLSLSNCYLVQIWKRSCEYEFVEAFFSSSETDANAVSVRAYLHACFFGHLAIK